MFVTTKDFRHPASALLKDEGVDLWRAVEVELRRPWFVVEVELPNDHRQVRTVLATRIEDVVGLSQSCNADGRTLRSVVLVTTQTDEQLGGWIMRRLSAIWVAREPSAPEVRAYILEGNDGSSHVDSRFDTDEPRLAHRHKVVALPT